MSKGETSVVRTISKAILFLVIATAVSGCEIVVQKATGYFLKQRMIEICGEEDKPCLAAVAEQYESCETKYANEWTAYVHAGPAKEDALLDAYMSRLFSCVVDKEGDAYFSYEPD